MSDTDKNTPKPGTTQDPNQADLNKVESWPDPHADVPDEPEGPEQKNPDPKKGPGTTQDPNQADRT